MLPFALKHVNVWPVVVLVKLFLESLITKSLIKSAKLLITKSLNNFPSQEKLVLAGKLLANLENR